ncbi:uncharacterized protein LOC132202298 [Neocloeon triangulifer]|uniref:uncharacterized protein LOC132202298 n=1 Tax=Neocloeon triangulifer TaxID=2078957 RepID=UPI00286EEF19|nr:uncharacterized protein LOC132202298 [Neocloeon triangulifer]
MGGGSPNKNEPLNVRPNAYPVAGRMVDERERLVGMTDAERAWRKQWLKDQHLSPNEPRFVPELERELMNPIRRFYRWPLDNLFKALMPVIGQQRAQSLRYYSGRIAIAYLLILGVTYNLKYNTNSWLRKGGFTRTYSQAAVLKGEPGYYSREVRSLPNDYNDRGFKSSPI